MWIKLRDGTRINLDLVERYRPDVRRTGEQHAVFVFHSGVSLLAGESAEQIDAMIGEATTLEQYCSMVVEQQVFER